jgi:hypothetical protein
VRRTPSGVPSLIPKVTGDLGDGLAGLEHNLDGFGLELRADHRRALTWTDPLSREVTVQKRWYTPLEPVLSGRRGRLRAPLTGV